jgi:predicted enzyme related to lactoylglutathione lyase
MARVTGIGGVFFKSRSNHQQLAAWYEKHLGLTLEPWGGAILKWPDDQAGDKGITVWNVAATNTDWFAPSDASFMINYRVDDLAQLVQQLQQAGIEILQGPETHENGSFAWICDPDGNKLELWQPA